jgi:purine-nucleoside phosphorylase
MQMIDSPGLVGEPETSLSEQAAALIRQRVGEVPVDVGLVLGAGLGAIADQVQGGTVIGYEDLPGFPAQAGPAAELVIGTLGTARVAVLKGRAHYYETGDIAAMRTPLETLRLLGANAVVLAGAAGSVKPEIKPGALVAIRDHINLTGINPLLGRRGGVVSLTGAYDPILRERFQLAAGEVGRRTSEAVYMWFPGPSFETPAEIQAARLLGADLVGMSTVPDVVLARHLGLRVLSIAMVTNYAAGVGGEPMSREHTMRVAGAAIVPLTRVLAKFFDIWLLDSRMAAR